MKTRSILLLCAAIGFLTSAGCASDRAAGGEGQSDAAKLQGTWAATSYFEDGKGETIAPEQSPVRFIFKGNHVTIPTDVEEASARGDFKLHAGSQPREIDLISMHGIYEFDNASTLKLCYGPEGRKRPKHFTSEPGSGHILITFKKMSE
jgi:uncharacterized protein (TIGR03067 family)